MAVGLLLRNGERGRRREREEEGGKETKEWGMIDGEGGMAR